MSSGGPLGLELLRFITELGKKSGIFYGEKFCGGLQTEFHTVSSQNYLAPKYICSKGLSKLAGGLLPLYF